MDISIIHKEIDLIQSCVNRMAKNSFLLKGWAITISGILLTITQAKSHSTILAFTVLLPLVCFWYLDAYFLRLERMYRKLYEWVIDARKAGNEEHLYDLNPHRFSSEVDSLLQTMWSCSLKYYYGAPILLMVLIISKI